MPSARSPDLVVLGRVHTADPARPDAGGVAIASGRVVAVDGRDTIRALAGAGTRIVDAGEGSVLPAFRDAHLHLLALGRQARRVDLHGLSVEEVREAVRAHAAGLPADAWVEGFGWSLEALGLDRPPDSVPLSDLAGGRPVLLLSHDHHAAWCSIEALGALGVLGGGPSVLPDVIERDRLGIPTGILREAAVFAAAGVAGAGATPEDDRAALLAAARGLLARGITVVDDMDGGRSVRAAASLRRSGRLPIRVNAALRLDDLPTFERTGLPPAMEDGALRITGVKLFLDGALGSRTAWLKEPYDDRPGETGLRTLPPGALGDAVARARALGLPCFVHAIGDAAVTAALDALAEAPGLPHRVEHAQLIDPADVPRFAALGVEASLQPAHMATDIPIATRAWGARGAHAFPARSLIDAGAVVRFGSDAPVEPAEPLWWIHAATTRTTHAGEPTGGWWPAERLTRVDAVARTVYGPLVAGAPADLVMFDRDLFAVPDEDLLDLRPTGVWMGGAEPA